MATKKPPREADPHGFRRDHDYREWIARLTSHIPDRGTHLVHYYGAYSNALRGVARRREIFLAVPPEDEPPDPRQCLACSPPEIVGAADFAARTRSTHCCALAARECASWASSLRPPSSARSLPTSGGASTP